MPGVFKIHNGSIVLSENFRIKHSGLIDHPLGFSILEHLNTVGQGFNGFVYAVKATPDNKIVVAGDFTLFDRSPHSRIIRFNPDFSIDTTFNIGSGFNGLVSDIAIQPDGKIIAVGGFTNYNSVTRQYCARINVDGTLDTTFVPYTFGTNTITVALQSDGKILVGGNAIGNYLVRLLPSGSLDSSFAAGTGPSNTVYTIAVNADDSFFIGGAFSSYNSVSRQRIAKINADGTLNTSFNTASAFNDIVYKIIVQNDDKILVGGAFTMYGSTTVNRLIRLNPDASIDSGFGGGTRANASIRDIAITPSGSFFIGGAFTTYNGVTRNRIAKINPDGTLDTGFNPAGGANNTVTDLLFFNDQIFLGGEFDFYNNLAYNYFVSSDQTGTPTAHRAFVVSNALTQSDNKVILLGGFKSTTNHNHILRINTDGSVDVLYNTGTGFNESVSGGELQSDDKLVAVGAFTSYNGNPRNRIVRINTDGTIDTTFSIGTGFNGHAIDCKIQSDGKIVVGGTFTDYNGSARNRIVRLNPNGSIDTTFNIGTGFNDRVNEIAVQPDNKIVSVGMFTAYAGQTRNRIVRINPDGTLDTTFIVGSGLNGVARTVSIQSDGKILVGGEFTQYDSVTKNRLVRLNPNGSIDTTFNIGTGFNGRVLKIKTMSNKNILVSGEFTTFNGIHAPYLVILHEDGSLARNLRLSFGANKPVSFAAETTVGNVLVGGWFSQFNNQFKLYIHRFSFETSNSKFCGSVSLVNGVATVHNTLVNTSKRIFVSHKNFIPNINTTLFEPSLPPIFSGSVSSTPSGIFALGWRPAGLLAFGSAKYQNTSVSLFNNDVLDLVVEPSGHTVFVGKFTTYNTASHNRILRLTNTDGISAIFGTGFNDAAHSITLQSDGKYIVGGKFTSYQSNARNRMVRLNTNGSIDTTFNIGTGFDNTVNTIAIQTDGKILVGGDFTDFNGNARNRIVRLNSNGTLDTTFNIGTGFDGSVHTISLQADGKILVGGDFTDFNGNARNRIVRLNSNGTLDTTFNVGNGLNSSVYSILVLSDQTILVGGDFTEYNNVTANKLLHLNSSGDVYKNYNYILFNGAIYKLTLHNHNNNILLVGGMFDFIDWHSGVHCGKFLALNLNGHGIPGALFVPTSEITNGSSFKIFSSSPLDNGDVSWMIL